MKKLHRLVRHLFTTKATARRFFPSDSLHALQTVIAQGEAMHRAEIRVIIEAALSLPAVAQGSSARQRAHKLFSTYRIWDTEENCGILLYINLADRKVEILADRTVNRLLSKQEWQTICHMITQGFANNVYQDSLLAGLRHLNDLLKTRFPQTGVDANQLSNRPVLL